MNRRFTFLLAAITLIVSMAMPLGVAGQTREEVVAYTLTPASGSNNSYAGNCDIAINGITWNLTGNSQMQPWRIGGKSLSGVDRTLYSKTAIADNITKIEVTHGSTSSITVNSMTVIVASNSSFSSVISTLTPTFAANSTVTIEKPVGVDWTGCYYKFVYNVTVSGSSNKFLEFSEAKFYKENNSGVETYTVTYDCNGGTSGCPENVTGIASNTSITLADAPAKANYTFDGWSNGSQTYPAGASYPVTGNVTFTAQWTENSGSGSGDTDIIDFENALSSYSEWEFTNIGTSNTAITAHQGSKYGANINANGSGVATASIKTKEKIANPDSLTCYISKVTTNTTSSTWKIQVSSNGSSWTDVASKSATSMSKGVWVKFAADLSEYSDVYVRIYYSGSTAIRAIDDITLTMVDLTAPVIVASNPAMLAYNANSGTIAYSITNPVDGESLSATTTDSWISNIVVGESHVTFSVSTNPISADRTGHITLSYAGAADKIITITQGHIEVATPTFSPAGGNYDSPPLTVAISCNTSGVTIHYTTDGTEPTTSSFTYSATVPIMISATTTVKAIAVKDGVSSAVATAVYNIVPVITPTATTPDIFAFEGGEGSFTFTVANFIDGTVFTASSTESWITDIELTDNTVSFQVGENTGLERTGTITIVCTKDDNTLASAQVEVTQEANPDHPGTEGNPYTVAQALEIIDGLETGATTGDVYVAGIITKIDQIEVVQYHDANYYISDRDAGNQLYVYYGRFWDDTDFMSEDELQLGDSVVIRGKLKKNNKNPKARIAEYNYIVYLERDVEPPLFSPSSSMMASGSTVYIYCETDGAEIYYTLDGTEPSESSTLYTDEIELTQNTTIKAIAYYDGKHSAMNTASYTIVPEGTLGLMDSPYNVAQALDAIHANDTIFGVYVKGIVDSIQEIDLNYKNATYFISDDGTFDNLDNQLKVFRGKGWGNSDIVSQDQLRVGDEVTVFGNLIYYKNTTKEVAAKNYIYAWRRPSSIIIEPNSISLDYIAIAGQIGVTYYDIWFYDVTHAPEVHLCDAQGNDAAYDWITVTMNESWNIDFTIDANAGTAPRKAYLKVVGCSSSNSEVASNIVTITQDGLSEEEDVYTSLPFHFNGNEEMPKCMTNSGVEIAAAYPYLEFNDGGDYLLLRINEAPGRLTYDIKGVSNYSGGYFKVLASDNNYDWTVVAVDSTTSISTTTAQGRTVDNIASNVRYIKWLYQTKSKGNVVIGNIHLAKPFVYYAVNLTQPEHGAISADKESAVQGETVVLTAYPDEGYSAFVSWEVRDEDNNEIEVVNNQFIMPASDVTVTAAFVPIITTYECTYSINGVSSVSQTDIPVGSSISLPGGANLNSTFVFDGWTADPNDVDHVMAAGASYTVVGDVTFYAVYREKLTSASGAGSFVKVTQNLGTNWAGDYLIAYNDAIFADGRVGGTGKNAIGAQNVKANPENNLQGDVVAADWGSTYYVTLEEIADGSNTYVLKTQDGKYNYYSSNNNGLTSTDTKATAATYPITVNFVSVGDIRLALGGSAAGAVFRYNTGGYFRYYKDCGQSPVYLYKRTDAANNRYTRVFLNETVGSVAIAGPSVIPSGSVLNVSQITNTLGADKLVIEEGGQLVAGSNVAATMQKTINPYTSDKDNYYLISSPINNMNPVEANMTGNTYDLYYFDPENFNAVDNEYEEWINYKSNHFNLQEGRGYLYANSYGGDITLSGTMKASVSEVALGYGEGRFAGWNLIGNPYPCNVTIGMPFYRLTEGGDALATEATLEMVALAPMEGVFVKATGANETASFTKAANTSTTGARSKGMLNLKVLRNRGQMIDNAIVRFDGGAMLGKFVLNPNNTRIYVPQEGRDYAVVRAEGQGEMPVNFKAEQNGTYTLAAELDDRDVTYLHLIDNITGTEVDLLQTPNYTFNAQTTDYASRFRLVFSTNDADDASAGSESFAFVDGNGNIVITDILGDAGTASLQVIDVMGRVLSSTVCSDAIHTISTNELVPGVYVLRLIKGNDVKTQKMVVR